MRRQPSLTISRFFIILKGFIMMAQEEPQNIVSFLANTSYSLPTRSAARKRVVLLLLTMGPRRCSQQSQVAMMSLLVRRSFQLSTQLVRKSRTSLLLLQTQSASQNWEDVKFLGLISMHIPTAHLIDFPSVVIKSKCENSFPSFAQRVSLKYRWDLRQLKISFPVRSTTAAELYSKVSPPSWLFSMYPNATYALIPTAILLANWNSYPSPAAIARGSASSGQVKLYPVNAIYGKTMISSLLVGEYILSDSATLSMDFFLLLCSGLIWQRRALKLRLSAWSSCI